MIQLSTWTAANRARMADIEKKAKRYSTDLTGEEWSQVAPLLPKPGRTGRRRRIDLREILNAVRYLARTGCGWRMLPMDFPPWPTVYCWFRRMVRLFLFRTIHDFAVMIDRERAGREASPSAGILDSPTVKAPAPGADRSFDGGKKIFGRKRHVAVDIDGRLLMVNLTPAGISDSAGAQMILTTTRRPPSHPAPHWSRSLGTGGRDRRNADTRPGSTSPRPCSTSPWEASSCAASPSEPSFQTDSKSLRICRLGSILKNGL